MPILVVMGIIGLLILHAVLTKPTMSSLDKGIPPAVGNAVLYAWANEPNADMRVAFAKVLAKNGYPIAADFMAPGTAPKPGAAPPKPTATTTPIKGPIMFRPGTFTTMTRP